MVDQEDGNRGPIALQKQSAIARLGLFALESRSLQEVMEETVRVVVEALGADLCSVLTLLKHDGSFLVRAGHGWDEGLVGSARVGSDADESLAGYTLATGRPVLVDVLDEETRFFVASRLVDHEIVSSLSVLIEGEEEPYGVLTAHTKHRRAFHEMDVNFLQAAANVLAGVIERKRVEDALRESEARAHAVLDTTVDGIVTIDERGLIESFNAAAERIFGYEAEEVIGRNVHVLMPPPYKEEHDEYIQNYIDTGRRKIIGIGREVVGRRKDGSTFPLDLAVSEVYLDDRRIFTGVVRDITDRRRLEHEILRISEQERRRIGQDLHDGLGQMLTGIGLITRNLARRLDAENEDHAADVAEIAGLLKEADEFARALARGLVPVDLEKSGLRYALQRLASGAEKLFGVRCTFEETGSVTIEDNSVATHLYRIAQEAVSNAVKHGKAQHVRMSIAGGDRLIRLRIHDDGVGFPDDFDADSDDSGMGVRIMRHRARIIGANLEIMAGLDDGTMITCSLRNHGSTLPAGGEEYIRNRELHTP